MILRYLGSGFPLLLFALALCAATNVDVLNLEIFPQLTYPPRNGTHACGAGANVTCDANNNVTALNFNCAMTGDFLNGTIPTIISKLSFLETLDLGNCGLKHTIPSEIGLLASLKNLWLRNNELTGTLPLALNNNIALESLQVDENSLTGKIPDAEYSNLVELLQFRGKQNLFTGTLPNWNQATKLSSLRFNYLSDMTSTLPSSWSTRTKLNYVDLSVSNFQGSLPPEWATLTELQYLYIQSNNINGTLPSEWAFMTAITNLVLRGNDIEGTIPSTWAALGDTLDDFDIRGNKLYGKIPCWKNTSLAGTCKLYDSTQYPTQDNCLYFPQNDGKGNPTNADDCVPIKCITTATGDSRYDWRLSSCTQPPTGAPTDSPTLSPTASPTVFTTTTTPAPAAEENTPLLSNEEYMYMGIGCGSLAVLSIACALIIVALKKRRAKKDMEAGKMPATAAAPGEKTEAQKRESKEAMDFRLSKEHSKVSNRELKMFK